MPAASRKCSGSLAPPACRPSGTADALSTLAAADPRPLREETALTAEARSVDDQVEWLSDREIAYALPDDRGGASAATSTWALAIDGPSQPRLLAPLAYSPAYVR